MRCKSVGGPARLRASASKRQAAASGSRCIKVATRGLVTLTIACMIFATALIAAGQLLAVSVDARSDTRSIVGMQAQSRGSLVSVPDSGMPVPLQVDLDSSGPETALFPDQDRPAPLSVTALAFPSSSGTLTDFTSDQLFTGSIDRFTTRFDAIHSTTTERTQIPAKIQERPAIASPMPVPRARPQLASLPPVDDIVIIPDGATHPARTAVYDINARTVYMPNGQRLEAHSGFGQYMDDPRYVRLRMRGVTPPNTYKLTMREARFHGVEAIRMTPLDQSAMFGRNGILVHPYLLGPNGQSNGCVSVKDYPKFLAAFKRGEVDTMVVVYKMDKPPVFARPGGFRSAANTR